MRLAAPTPTGLEAPPAPTRPGRPLVLALIALSLGGGAAARAEDDPAAEIAALRRQLAEKDRVIERLNARLADHDDAATPPPMPVPPPATPPGPARPLATTPIEPPPPPRSAAPTLPALIAPAGTRWTDSRLFDNLSVFAGLDGSKQPQDFGVNAVFGGRFDVNWGLPILPERGVGLQVGTSINASENAVGVFQRIQGTRHRLQNFTTVGLYQRTDWGLDLGVGYDLLYEQYFDRFHLGQWRGKVGYALDDRNEIGGRLMLRSYGANGRFGAVPVTLNPIDMGTLFFRHTWASGASTGFWAGLADRHTQTNIALGDAAPIAHPFVYGADVEAPLTDHLVLFGQANFITPPQTGTVDAFLGITYYPASRSRRERSKRLRPVMPVANNPTFAVDLGRRR